MSARTCIGIPEPESERPGVEAMRAAIEAHRLDSAVIYHCFEAAEVYGLSDEEKYIALAYHALRQLEDMARELARCAATMPIRNA